MPVKNSILVLAAVFAFLFSPIRAGADPIPDEVAKAFADAGLRLLKNSVSPIDFTINFMDKESIKLSGLKGKVVFLNFWATWCGPCRQEMPSMERLYQKFKDKGFEIAAVNGGENPKDVGAFMKTNKLNFPAALDKSGEIHTRYGVRAIPTTVIIDRNGMIIARITGTLNWDSPQIAAAFETLLARK
jgi:thiol-disulfide isomerase/thioredoxin